MTPIVDLHMVVQPQHLEIVDDVTYVVMPKIIFGRDLKTTRRIAIELVKVLGSEDTGDVTWELE